MKVLKKLALVSAVSMISAGAFAMEAMDDEAMASAVGQDGIHINVILPQVATAGGVAGGAGGTGDGTIYGLAAPSAGQVYKGIVITQVRIHDDDGLTGLGLGSNPTDGGALVIGNGTAAESTVVYESGVSATLLPIQLDIDTTGDANGDSTATDAMLNVKITLPTLHIHTGAIYVANSNAAAGVDGTTISNMSAKIMNGMDITMGASVMNIQLANEAQGSMIALNTTLTGGLTLANVGLNDVAGTAGLTSGGTIAVGSMAITNNASGTMIGTATAADLSLGVAIDVVDNTLSPFLNGLRVTLNSFGSTTTATGLGGADIAMNNIALGAAGSADLGDVQIIGLQLAGTSLVISGK